MNAEAQLELAKLFNQGNALLVQGRLDEAVDRYRQVLRIKPDYAEAHSCLGSAFQAQGKLDEAVAACRQGILLKPDSAVAHFGFGNVLQVQGRYDEAVASYQMALQVKPDWAEVHSCLGQALLVQGRQDEAVASFRRAIEIKPDLIDTSSSLIFTLDLTLGADTSMLQAERRRWSERYIKALDVPLPFPNMPDPERRLRVGYVSADFRGHSASVVFGAMLVNFDAAMFDVYAYSNSAKDDENTSLFRQSVTGWRKIAGLPDDAVADMIRQDGIDILVDLSGHSAENRLPVFACKPAPIQITAWGYAGGTGMKAMDVFFADPVLVPPDEKAYYAEEVRYLPSVISAFFPEQFPEVNGLPAVTPAKVQSQSSCSRSLLAEVCNAWFRAGRSKPASVAGPGVVTFGSLNRLSKVTPAAIKVWSRVLLAVPGSKMLLKAPGLEDAGTRDRLLGQFIQSGVEPERLIVLGGSDLHDHRVTYQRIDISLDPFPHGGGVTTLEGLMMGVPVLTLRWPTLPGRLSASILTTLGLTDWIAETEDEYVAIAVRKAGDLLQLAELRRELRGRFMRSIIGDTGAYVRAVEEEYRKLWREWCSGRGEIEASGNLISRGAN